MTYTAHPIAELFPLMRDRELQELANDIRDRGQQLAISLLAGTDQILDGRNRLAACKLAGVDPVVERVEVEDVAHYVCSRNLHRRHYTAAERAALAVEMLPMLEAEAAVSQASTRFGSSDGADEIVHTGRARDRAAAATGASPSYVRDMKRLKERAPDVYEEVVDGPLSVPEGVVLMQLRQDERSDVLRRVHDGLKVREAIDAHFADRGIETPGRFHAKNHRDRVIEDVKDLLRQAVAIFDECDAGASGAWVDDAQPAAELVRRAEKLSRDL